MDFAYVALISSSVASWIGARWGALIGDQLYENWHTHTSVRESVLAQMFRLLPLNPLVKCSRRRTAAVAGFTRTVYLARIIEPLRWLMTEIISGIDRLSARGVIALLILRWKDVFFPPRVCVLKYWCIDESKRGDQLVSAFVGMSRLTLILGSPDFSSGISNAFREVCSVRTPLWVTPPKVMVWWNFGAKMKWKVSTNTLPKQFQHPWKTLY